MNNLLRLFLGLLGVLSSHTLLAVDSGHNPDDTGGNDWGIMN